jgi:hypothetical protein
MFPNIRPKYEILFHTVLSCIVLNYIIEPTRVTRWFYYILKYYVCPSVIFLNYESRKWHEGGNSNK